LLNLLASYQIPWVLSQQINNRTFLKLSNRTNNLNFSPILKFLSVKLYHVEHDQLLFVFLKQTSSSKNISKCEVSLYSKFLSAINNLPSVILSYYGVMAFLKYHFVESILNRFLTFDHVFDEVIFDKVIKYFRQSDNLTFNKMIKWDFRRCGHFNGDLWQSDLHFWSSLWFLTKLFSTKWSFPQLIPSKRYSFLLFEFN
jgi:hypothetical protein